MARRSFGFASAFMLVAKIPHSRRWRGSLAGRGTMTTAIKLREAVFPSLLAAVG